MSKSPPEHTDRRRAESFGAIANEYDRYRPHFPQPLIDGLITQRGILTADIGAGTGIASVQLMEAGAHVVAVEPDARMARVATDKAVSVEQATFEEWQPAGRSFDLVVFAQSFHWVEPRSAIEKVLTILRPAGRLAILANRIIPTAPTQEELDAVSADYLDVRVRPVGHREAELTALLEEFGFAVERRCCLEHLHYTAEDYMNLVSTYSNHSTLEPTALTELRSRLEQKIGSAGVAAHNDALAFVCTPPSSMEALD
ncbi:class I SAM-dependent methyltransferase [Mycobacterium sp.]|uniref:class I SAM-dependent methyltransferase n=1 Tax=Mycobacterium sp. TaxID=1785 RepID=UPI002C8984BD|nr:class I SAM-dependent methyltransferase [Mycobacterium sp.]HKP44577.1 class I SAM-dependent methyltransferase [Mycobacterium sp.]